MSYVFTWKLSDLHPSDTCWEIRVQVNRAFLKTELDIYGAERGWPKKLLSLDFIFVDNHSERMLASVVGDHLIQRFFGSIDEGKCYYIKGFTVQLGGEGLNNHYKIIYGAQTEAEEWDVLMVEHGF